MIILTAAVVITGINTPENTEYAVKMHNKATLQDAVTLYVMTEMLNNIDNFVVTSTGATKARDVADIVKDLYENGSWKTGAEVKLGISMTNEELNTVFELDDKAVVTFAAGQEPTLDGTEGGNDNQPSSNPNQSSSNPNQSSGNDNQQGSIPTFTWSQATIDTSGKVGTSGKSLNNYLTDVVYVENMTIKLLADNVMFKIAYYNQDGSFKNVGAWQSRAVTQWTQGGVNEIAITDSYVRIAIADTTMNNTSDYTLTMDDYASRYSFE